MEVSILRCGGCGAPREDRTSRCSYCRGVPAPGTKVTSPTSGATHAPSLLPDCLVEEAIIRAVVRREARTTHVALCQGGMYRFQQEMSCRVVYETGPRGGTGIRLITPKGPVLVGLGLYVPDNQMRLSDVDAPEPAYRLRAVQKLVEAGLVDPREALRLLDDPGWDPSGR